MDAKEMILPTDEGTILKVETVPVYYSRHGKPFLTEQSARNDGATHNFCKCGQPKTKSNIYCEACEPKEEDRYLKKPFKEWDSETPLVIYGDDQYFFDEDSILEYCDENEIEKTTDLRLCICEPNHFTEIEPDYWSDIWPENADELPKEVDEALKKFNAVLNKAKPFSWSEGAYRTTVELTIR